MLFLLQIVWLWLVRRDAARHMHRGIIFCAKVISCDNDSSNKIILDTKMGIVPSLRNPAVTFYRPGAGGEEDKKTVSRLLCGHFDEVWCVSGRLWAPPFLHQMDCVISGKRL